jgi:hypothetical protein
MDYALITKLKDCVNEINMEQIMKINYLSALREMLSGRTEYSCYSNQINTESNGDILAGFYNNGDTETNLHIQVDTQLYTVNIQPKSFSYAYKKYMINTLKLNPEKITYVNSENTEHIYAINISLDTLVRKSIICDMIETPVIKLMDDVII